MDMGCCAVCANPVLRLSTPRLLDGPVCNFASARDFLFEFNVVDEDALFASNSDLCLRCLSLVLVCGTIDATFWAKIDQLRSIATRPAASSSHVHPSRNADDLGLYDSSEVASVSLSHGIFNEVFLKFAVVIVCSFVLF